MTDIKQIMQEFEEKFGTDIYKHTSGYWDGSVAVPSRDEHVSVEIVNWLQSKLTQIQEEARREGRKELEEEISELLSIGGKYKPVSKGTHEEK